ncbi:MAG: hypothetical protein JPMHGGIA_01479 [Saprospiraceae bacterium]|jgi:hypothetical protein|nr:hypothetical protein [Saprospiraceae bacterium]
MIEYLILPGLKAYFCRKFSEADADQAFPV